MTMILFRVAAISWLAFAAAATDARHHHDTGATALAPTAPSESFLSQGSLLQIQATVHRDSPPNPDIQYLVVVDAVLETDPGRRGVDPPQHDEPPTLTAASWNERLLSMSWTNKSAVSSPASAPTVSESQAFDQRRLQQPAIVGTGAVSLLIPFDDDNNMESNDNDGSVLYMISLWRRQRLEDSATMPSSATKMPQYADLQLLARRIKRLPRTMAAALRRRQDLYTTMELVVMEKDDQDEEQAEESNSICADELVKTRAKKDSGANAAAEPERETVQAKPAQEEDNEQLNLLPNATFCELDDSETIPTDANYHDGFWMFWSKLLLAGFACLGLGGGLLLMHYANADAPQQWAHGRLETEAAAELEIRVRRIIDVAENAGAHRITRQGRTLDADRDALLSPRVGRRKAPTENDDYSEGTKGKEFAEDGVEYDDGDETDSDWEQNSSKGEKSDENGVKYDDGVDVESDLEENSSDGGNANAGVDDNDEFDAEDENMAVTEDTTPQFEERAVGALNVAISAAHFGMFRGGEVASDDDSSVRTLSPPSMHRRMSVTSSMSFEDAIQQAATIHEETQLSVNVHSTHQKESPRSDILFGKLQQALLSQDTSKRNQAIPHLQSPHPPSQLSGSGYLPASDGQSIQELNQTPYNSPSEALQRLNLTNGERKTQEILATKFTKEASSVRNDEVVSATSVADATVLEAPTPFDSAGKTSECDRSLHMADSTATNSTDIETLEPTGTVHGSIREGSGGDFPTSNETESVSVNDSIMQDEPATAHSSDGKARSLAFVSPGVCGPDNKQVALQSMTQTNNVNMSTADEMNIHACISDGGNTEQLAEHTVANALPELQEASLSMLSASSQGDQCPSCSLSAKGCDDALMGEGQSLNEKVDELAAVEEKLQATVHLDAVCMSNVPSQSNMMPLEQNAKEHFQEKRDSSHVSPLQQLSNMVTVLFKASAHETELGNAGRNTLAKSQAGWSDEQSTSTEIASGEQAFNPEASIGPRTDASSTAMCIHDSAVAESVVEIIHDDPDVSGECTETGCRARGAFTTEIDQSTTQTQSDDEAVNDSCQGIGQQRPLIGCADDNFKRSIAEHLPVQEQWNKSPAESEMPKEVMLNLTADPPMTQASIETESQMADKSGTSSPIPDHPVVDATMLSASNLTPHATVNGTSVVSQVVTAETTNLGSASAPNEAELHAATHPRRLAFQVDKSKQVIIGDHEKRKVNQYTDSEPPINPAAKRRRSIQEFSPDFSYVSTLAADSHSASSGRSDNLDWDDLSKGGRVVPLAHAHASEPTQYSTDNGCVTHDGTHEGESWHAIGGVAMRSTRKLKVQSDLGDQSGTEISQRFNPVGLESGRPSVKRRRSRRARSTRHCASQESDASRISDQKSDYMISNCLAQDEELDFRGSEVGSPVREHAKHKPASSPVDVPVPDYVPSIYLEAAANVYADVKSGFAAKKLKSKIKRRSSGNEAGAGVIPKVERGSGHASSCDSKSSESKRSAATKRKRPLVKVKVEPKVTKKLNMTKIRPGKESRRTRNGAIAQPDIAVSSSLAKLNHADINSHSRSASQCESLPSKSAVEVDRFKRDVKITSSKAKTSIRTARRA